MPFASLACGSLLCVFCPGAHRHRAGIKTTVPNAEEIRIAHNLAYSQAGLVTSIDGGVLNRFWGTHPLAYARGSLNLAKSTRLLPSRDRQGRFPSGIPKRVSTLDGEMPVLASVIYWPIYTYFSPAGSWLSFSKRLRIRVRRRDNRRICLFALDGAKSWRYRFISRRTAWRAASTAV